MQGQVESIDKTTINHLTVIQSHHTHNNITMSKPKQKAMTNEEQLRRIEELKQAKRKKKELKEQQQREKKLKEEQAIIDKEVVVIYSSGLADAYKYFLQEAYREEVKFNIYEYAAQKILKYEKLKKQKERKLSSLQSK